jgi:hypothetical protein
MQDAYVVLPPSQSYTQVKKEHAQPGRRDPDIKPRVKVGNSHTLERRRVRREEMEKHDRNKEAWYEKNDHWARAWPSGWEGPEYDHPYGDGEPRWNIDEDDISSENEDGSEDGSEDDDLDEDDDGMELDMSPNIWPQADATTSTLTDRANSVRLVFFPPSQ